MEEYILTYSVEGVYGVVAFKAENACDAFVYGIANIFYRSESIQDSYATIARATRENKIADAIRAQDKEDLKAIIDNLNRVNFETQIISIIKDSDKKVLYCTDAATLISATDEEDYDPEVLY